MGMVWYCIVWYRRDGIEGMMMDPVDYVECSSIIGVSGQFHLFGLD